MTVTKQRVMAAGVDRVWEILADQAREPKYWATIRDVKVIRTEGNTVERKATVGPRAFSQKSVQTVTFEPKKRIRLAIEADSMVGRRLIELKALEGGSTQVEVSWDFEVRGVPGFVQGLVKGQIAGATEKALEKIAAEVEPS